MWTEGADWKMRKTGITGKIWRVQRKLDIGGEGELRINGRNMGRRTHDIGVSQGTVSAPRKFKWLQHNLIERIMEQEEGIGIKVGEWRIAGVIYVDDIATINMRERRADMRKAIEDDTKKWRYTLEQNKREEIETEEKKKKKDTKELKILGEIIDNNVERGQGQIDETMNEIMGKTRQLAWMAGERDCQDAGAQDRHRSVHRLKARGKTTNDSTTGRRREKNNFSTGRTNKGDNGTTEEN